MQSIIKVRKYRLDRLTNIICKVNIRKATQLISPYLYMGDVDDVDVMLTLPFTPVILFTKMV